MMKPCHAITKCDSPLPRPFSRAFHPINLVAAEVTRLKLHLAARFDDLPAFVPTGINLIRLNPAKKKLFPGVATACRHNRPRLGHGPRLWQSPAAALRPARRPNLQPSARKAEKAGQSQSNRVQPSPTQSNQVKPMRGPRSSSSSSSSWQAEHRLRPSVLSYFKLIKAKFWKKNPMRSLPNLTLQPASRALAQRRRVQVSPTQSNQVQVSQTESNLCEVRLRLKPCVLGRRQPVATTSSLPANLQPATCNVQLPRSNQQRLRGRPSANQEPGCPA